MENLVEFFQTQGFHTDDGKANEKWEDIKDRITTFIGQDRFSARCHDATIEAHRCLAPFSRRGVALSEVIRKANDKDFQVTREALEQLEFAHRNFNDIKLLFSAQTDATSVNVEMRVHALKQRESVLKILLRRLEAKPSTWQLVFNPSQNADVEKTVLDAVAIDDFRRQLGFYSNTSGNESVSEFSKVMYTLEELYLAYKEVEAAGHFDYFPPKPGECKQIQVQSITCSPVRASARFMVRSCYYSCLNVMSFLC